MLMGILNCSVVLTLVIQKVDSAIQWINLCSMDKAILPILIRWIVIYPVDTEHYPAFEQLGRSSLFPFLFNLFALFHKKYTL